MLPALAAVIEQHVPACLTAFAARMPQSHVRAVERILACRTEAAGRIYYQCPQCDGWQMAPASCGHRACNACGHEKAMPRDPENPEILTPHRPVSARAAANHTSRRSATLRHATPQATSEPRKVTV